MIPKWVMNLSLYEQPGLPECPATHRNIPSSNLNLSTLLGLYIFQVHAAQCDTTTQSMSYRRMGFRVVTARPLIRLVCSQRVDELWSFLTMPR